MYDIVTKLCRQQALVAQNHENDNVRQFEQYEAQHTKYKRLKLGGGRPCDHSKSLAAALAKAKYDGA